MTHAVIAVPLGALSYDVTVGHGVLDGLPQIAQSACPAARYGIITDSTVAQHHGARVAEGIATVAPCDLVTFPAGEWNKTPEQWRELSERLLAAGVGRDGAIIALGGGVTGDLAGFVAATFLRGIPYVQVPTTLLAMIDSSVGGKTGVDTSHGKNLLGAFHQPRAVIADVDTLRTLPPVHLAAGMAEAIKHGAILDRRYFDWMLEQRDAVRERDPAALQRMVHRSVELKAGVVAEDEHEAGRRAILNFGHTVAHAIEAVSGYEVLHGEAVAMGIVVEAQLGQHLGVTAPETADVLRDALMRFNLPVELPDVPLEALLEAMERDKKVRAGSVRFALLQHVGKAARSNTENWTFAVPADAIISALRSCS